jgi:cyclin H
MTVPDQQGQDPAPSKLPPLFHHSSQYRHWRFSPSDLSRIRKETHDAAVQEAQANIKKHNNIKVEKGETLADTDTNVTFITTEEALQLCSYYEARITGFTRVFKFSNEVQATAIMFFKRFFLHNSVLDFHPKNVL